MKYRGISQTQTVFYATIEMLTISERKCGNGHQSIQLEGRIREQENQSTRLDKRIDDLTRGMHDSFQQISGYFLTLEQQIGEIQAGMSEMEKRIRTEMATRQDIADTKTKIAEIERHLRVDMLANTADMKERMAEVGKDILSDIKELIVALDPRRASQ